MLKFSQTTQAQKNFIYRVCSDLNRNFDQDQVAVYGDGSESPNGEKFAAERRGDSWRVVFDFGIGRNYHTTVDLPEGWR